MLSETHRGLNPRRVSIVLLALRAAATVSFSLVGPCLSVEARGGSARPPCVETVNIQSLLSFQHDIRTLNSLIAIRALCTPAKGFEGLKKDCYAIPVCYEMTSDGSRETFFL